jgi:serine/threonine protein phosphatase PrpC
MRSNQLAYSVASDYGSNTALYRIQLVPEDEFFILGCDGIWDCLSNERAVDYVRQRIDHQTPSEIGASMLDDILSVDPRVTQGIGGDNMTVMIIDLQPQSRSYRRKQHTI